MRPVRRAPASGAKIMSPIKEMALAHEGMFFTFGVAASKS